MRVREGHKDKAIIEAAIKVIAENGYYGAKIHKIAELAGVATGSIYSYYENKLQIIFAIFDNVWRGLSGKLDLVELDTTLTPSQKLESLIDMVFDLLTENQDLALVFAHEQNVLIRDYPDRFTPYFEKFIQTGQQIVAQGITAGVFNPAVNVFILRKYLMGGISGCIQAWAIDPASYSLAEIRDQLKLLAHKGVNL
jgi:TetR/AcrR family fatty acid metabolism transcriptional regulator